MESAFRSRVVELRNTMKERMGKIEMNGCELSYGEASFSRVAWKRTKLGIVTADSRSMRVFSLCLLGRFVMSGELVEMTVTSIPTYIYRPNIQSNLESRPFLSIPINPCHSSQHRKYPRRFSLKIATENAENPTLAPRNLTSAFRPCPTHRVNQKLIRGVT